MKREDIELLADIDVYISAKDGAVVIHVDTTGIPDNERGPICRIYLNDDLDDPLWDNSIAITKKG